MAFYILWLVLKKLSLKKCQYRHQCPYNQESYTLKEQKTLTIIMPHPTKQPTKTKQKVVILTHGRKDLGTSQNRCLATMKSEKESRGPELFSQPVGNEAQTTAVELVTIWELDFPSLPARRRLPSSSPLGGVQGDFIESQDPHSYQWPRSHLHTSINGNPEVILRHSNDEDHPPS